MFSRMARKLKEMLYGTPAADRRDVKKDTAVPVFTDESVIEVPLTVDISPVIGIKNRKGCRLKLARVQDLDDRPSLEECWEENP